MSESKLQSKILKWLKKNNYWAFKTITCNKNGIMDIICCSPTGEFVGIEVKFGDGRPSELQKYHIGEVKKRGGKAFLAYDLETVVKELS